MVRDDVLAAPCYEDELFDTCFLRLFDRELDDRLVDDGQHLLGHGFCGGQKSRAHAGDGKDGFLDEQWFGHELSQL
jgi:hypothetical protein